ncbi:MAG TPA: phenolic acid decarboxylase [Victivallales bacterium]|nr:phenolic acid decarboxylase [Victivallales bacterium]
MKYPDQNLDGILGKHLILEYENGWVYEIYFKNSEYVDYRIHSGPVAGRWVNNREVSMVALGHEIYRINWVEPTGNVVTIVTSITERWFHDYFLMPQWVYQQPELTICHENKFIDEMLKYRDQGPTWPMETAIDSFGRIKFITDVGINRNDVIECSPSELPAGFGSQSN